MVSLLFNRDSARFTERYEKDLDMFHGDDYTAKWLTRICYPEMLPRKVVLLDTPEIRTTLGMVDWSKLNFDKINPEEVF